MSYDSTGTFFRGVTCVETGRSRTAGLDLSANYFFIVSNDKSKLFLAVSAEMVDSLPLIERGHMPCEKESNGLNIHRFVIEKRTYAEDVSYIGLPGSFVFSISAEIAERYLPETFRKLNEA